VLTFFGFMHGHAIGIAQTPLVATSYLFMGGLLYACAKFVPVSAPAPEPAHHEELPEGATEAA
jgi:adenine/guanine/hypoxanthine permease